MSDVEDINDKPEAELDAETDQRYRVWKKNAPYLYDYCVTTSWKWPSLTVQFFPDIVTHANYSCQRVLFGTLTNGVGNDHLSIAQVAVPTITSSMVDDSKYNPDKQEFEVKFDQPGIKETHTINHQGDVNRARYMPQNPNVIASANNVGLISIYERTKLSMRQPEGEVKNHTQFVAKDNHVLEIYSIDWNRHMEGQLVSGDSTGVINWFDLNHFGGANKIINEYENYQHVLGINDIEYVPHHSQIVAAGDESGNVLVYDLRVHKTVLSQKITTEEITSVSCNPERPDCIAAGDTQGQVTVGDIRQFGNEFLPIYQESHHTEAITQLKWHPRHPTVVGTSSEDRLVKLYDVNAKELLFAHEGHLYAVYDFDWSHHDDWMVALVGHDNSLQVWRPLGF